MNGCIKLKKVYLKVLEKKETVNILVTGDSLEKLIVDSKLPAPLFCLPHRLPMFVQPKKNISSSSGPFLTCRSRLLSHT